MQHCCMGFFFGFAAKPSYNQFMIASTSPTQNPVAIFGMSADPAHKGHLKIAETLHNMGYSRVLFMITPQNPFKKTSKTSFEHRMALARLLIGRRQWLELSDAEAWMQIYGEELRTHSMLTHMRQIYPNTPFTFVMGSDNWQHFHEWGKYKDLLNLCALLIIPRPGSTRLGNTIAAQTLSHLQDHNPTGPVRQGHWRFYPTMPGGPASATQIRRAILTGTSSKWLNNQQKEYIRLHNLYT